MIGGEKCMERCIHYVTSCRINKEVYDGWTEYDACKSVLHFKVRQLIHTDFCKFNVEICFENDLFTLNLFDGDGCGTQCYPDFVRVVNAIVRFIAKTECSLFSLHYGMIKDCVVLENKLVEKLIDLKQRVNKM